MSISYDTMSAYYKRKNDEIKNEDIAAQRKITDAALSQIESNRAQIKDHTEGAARAAYIQKDRAENGLQSETSRINNLATTERLVRGLNTQQRYNDTALDNTALRVNAAAVQNDAATEAAYGKRLADTELAIRLAQDEQDRAYKKAQADKKAQEGYLESLVELSRQSNYDYDFDADIFALKQQGYTNDDWQVQYYQEAKRLQAREKAKLKAKKKSSGSVSKKGDDRDYKSPGGDGGDGGDGNNFAGGSNISWQELRTQGAAAGLPSGLGGVFGLEGRDAAMVRNAINEYNSGNSSIEILSGRLRALGLGIDENGNLRRL